jgi:hypothetical protein
MFRTVRLCIIRSLFTVHSAMVYVIQVCRQFSSRTRIGLHPGPARNTFVKLVHLVGFITKKFVMMHGHMNVKFHYCVFKNMPRSQVLSQNNPYYPLRFYFFKIHFITTLLSTCRSSKLSLSFRFVHCTINNQTQECFLIISKPVK